MQAPRRELHLFFAAENDRAVILYRANSSLYRLISWRTIGDHFEPGQWLKTGVYETSCGLSPDGEFFVYGAKLRGSSFHYTALSRVPYFTALEFHGDLTIASVGGYFLDKGTVTFKHTINEERHSRLSCGLSVNSARKNWWHSMNNRAAGISYEDGVSQRASVQVKRGKIPDLLECYHCDGAKLYRKTAKGLELLLDCSDMEFEPIQAPYEGVTKARP
ncbi:hypothetical protein [Phaeobacter sp. 11ANDIMAR09]|uniref:hypothetical protein n=1 Tax=Phaeobacter sp. 11ANDIMAR09 TaxID=1225647 RepID=UPI0006C8DF50|nr:hypothetical protein [Phaeobacter sp. 11ANDIMAR09]KPD13476.1 hypothetical protein AN476_04600 [Phaeobacter sp. 11ANDIMAR09]